MITAQQLTHFRSRAKKYLDQAAIVLTDEEAANIEVAEFGLGRPEEIGLQLVVYINTERCCAKELVLLPWQICPEHRHPAIAGQPGKEETFRCRWGRVLLYVPGTPAAKPQGRIPLDKKDTFTVWHEIELLPGQQYTLTPNTLHWFQAGAEGVVVSEFSTASHDEADVFTDAEINRITKVAND
jgi:D-lyxose ketol-isomerase